MPNGDGLVGGQVDPALGGQEAPDLALGSELGGEGGGDDHLAAGRLLVDVGHLAIGVLF